MDVVVEIIIAPSSEMIDLLKNFPFGVKSNILDGPLNKMNSKQQKEVDKYKNNFVRYVL